MAVRSRPQGNLMAENPSLLPELVFSGCPGLLAMSLETSAVPSGCPSTNRSCSPDIRRLWIVPTVGRQYDHASNLPFEETQSADTLRVRQPGNLRPAYVRSVTLIKRNEISIKCRMMDFA